MKIIILRESGYDEALFGLGFSRGITSEMEIYDFLKFNDDGDSPEYTRLEEVARNLASKDGGHNKALESMMVWLDIDAPLYWWKQIDTYRAPEDGDGGFLPSGITKQSESTMHSLLKRELKFGDFEERGIDGLTLNNLNVLIKQGNFDLANKRLPHSFLQRRLVVSNYKALRNIYQQRCAGHKLNEWCIFCDELVKQLDRPEFLK